MGKKNGHSDMDLVPQGAAPESGLGEYLIENEAEAWGLDLRNASHTYQKIWTEQERFLRAFRIGGTIKAGLKNIEVCRRTVELWRPSNLLRFQDRFQVAYEEFADSQEEILYALNSGLKPGQNPVGLLATVNAHRPEKWRANIQVTHEVGREVMATLQKIQEHHPGYPGLREASGDKPWMVEGTVAEEEQPEVGVGGNPGKAQGY